jgi:hypothetical protein
MGRHTASYIAAQHRISAGPTAPGAAMYVGRVGLLALALGIGAVVAGCAGIANAEGPADNAGGTAAHSSDSPTGAGTVKGSPSAGSPGAKTRKRGLSPVPGIKLAHGRRAPISDRRSSLAATRSATTEPSIRRSGDSAAEPVRAARSPANAINKSSAPSPSTTGRAPMSAATAAHAEPAIANPVATVVPGVVSALAVTPSAVNTGGAPAVPMPMVQTMVQLVHREVERIALGANHFGPAAGHTPVGVNAVPAIAPGVPAPTDQAPTVYGEIGKWMLQSNGQISNYGGLPHGGRTVLEPVNVIIVDPTSTSAAESARKLNTAMFWSGFPAQPIHSTGFHGTIDDVTYGQQPTGLLVGYSDNFFLFPNNHGRIFGPDPVETSTGYVWSGSFSTEQFVIYELLPRHAYVSSNLARNALAMRLIASGQATYGGMVPLDNSYNTATTTTGDHDGYAVVIVLK